MKGFQLVSWVAALSLVSASIVPGFNEDVLSLAKRQGAACNRDNCLRGMLEPRISPSAVAFCATYTASVVTEPTAIPTYLNCNSLPSRVSSACSCLKSASSSTSTTQNPSTTTTLIPPTSTSVFTSSPSPPPSSSTTASSISSTTTGIIPSQTPGGAGSPTNPTPGCKFGPQNRGCWSKDFNVLVDSEERWPITGKTVKYSLEITNMTLAPDGVPKQMLVVNGTYPGPTLSAQWGDMLEIKVTNRMQHNGTSMHWHGFRQLNTNSEDGVDAVTECPIVPGQTRTYTFRASQHGTSWYHSHFTNQYGDGVLGAIVIEGPATENYDHDLGAMTISDHYYLSMYQTALLSRDKRPPNTDNGLIKGRNKSPDKTAGSYHTEYLFPGKKYRLRIINTGVVNSLAFHLDGHKFKVISADMVPIIPYETDWMNIHIGQRYDIVFTASIVPGNFWFRVAAPASCSVMDNNDGILAIFNIGAKPGEPTTTAVYPTDCNDEKNIVPLIVRDVPKDQFTVSGDSNLTSTLDEAKLNVWTINGTGIKLDPANPTLEYIDKGDTSYRENKGLAIYELLKPDVWQFLLIQNTYEVPHPLHLHGHDARILGSSYGPGVFSEADIPGLNFANPIRRDTYMMPPVGWVLIAFKVDNPGAWLFHCHIVWHTPEGMAIQFLELPDQIKQKMSLETLAPDCASWDDWFKTSLHPIDPPVEEDQ